MEDSRVWLTQKVKRLANRVLNHSGLLKQQRERVFVENGSKLFEELITCCKDKCRCNLIRSFSAKQVLEATNYFESHFSNDLFYKWYRGSLDDRPVLIKKYVGEFNENGAYRDIAIGSQMSSHKNALKLLGCCLEFSGPALVFEDAENGPLSNTGGIDFSGSSLSWNTRLRVAKEIANAITYLHTAFARPIIHRDIAPSNIFLDKNYVPKLCGFSLSITIPEGETQVQDAVHGRFSVLDPVFIRTSILTERSDVYGFGVLLLILLTGQGALDFNRPEDEQHISNYVVKMVEQERFKETVDPKILEEGGGVNPLKELQLKAFLKLALSCCIKNEREERPLMIDVAKELVKIEKSTY